MLNRNVHFWVSFGIAYFVSWIVIAVLFQRIKISYRNYGDRLFCNILSILGPVSVIAMLVVLSYIILYEGIWSSIRRSFKSE